MSMKVHTCNVCFMLLYNFIIFFFIDNEIFIWGDLNKELEKIKQILLIKGKVHTIRMCMRSKVVYVCDNDKKQTIHKKE